MTTRRIAGTVSKEPTARPSGDGCALGDFDDEATAHTVARGWRAEDGERRHRRDVEVENAAR